MAPRVHLVVPGANTYTIPMVHLEQLQALVAELGATAFPLLLRLGGKGLAQMQPVMARALLAEVETALSRLEGESVPSLLFLNGSGQVLGGMLGRPEGADLVRSKRASVAVNEEGIRITLQVVPPPVGFRSAPGLPAGSYLCYFDRISTEGEGFAGTRTAAMGGSGAPVPLPDLPLPPVTGWDFAAVAGKPAVSEWRFMRLPVADAYRDVIHALVTATNESIRLRAPVQVRVD